jgi:flagellar protein FlgJ
MKPADASNELAMDVQSLGRVRQMAQQNPAQALKESAKQFEALFINMMLQSMRQATPQGNLMGESHDRELYTSMLDQQLSQTMAQRGIGVADLLTGQLKHTSTTQAVQDMATQALATAGISPKISTPLTFAPGSAADVYALPSLMQVNSVKTAINDAAVHQAPVGSVSSSAQDFNAKMAAHAEEAAAMTGIPVAFILGHAALESGWGKREIKLPDGSSSHNVFGIKAGASWKGNVAEVTTTEYKQGVPSKVVARFRAYDSPAEAFRDYASLLQDNPRYGQVLANGQSVDGFAQGLQKAGYATDPAYATKLMSVIRRIQPA